MTTDLSYIAYVMLFVCGLSAHQPVVNSSQSQPASNPHAPKLVSPTGTTLSASSTVVSLVS